MPQKLIDVIRPDSVRAIVFDCDGLLVDSESAWTRAETLLYAGLGVEFAEQHKRDIIGRSASAVLEVIERHLDRPGDGEVLWSELLRLYEQEAEHGHGEMPGASEMVRRCAARVPVAVASSAPREHLDSNIASLGLDDLLAVRVNGESVKRLKPAPDPYLLACERLAVDPTTAVAFEDSATGAASAMAAGLRVIAVPTVAGSIDDAAWVATSLQDAEIVAWASRLGAK
ncbi:HAD family hydrolase [Demequina oxidasica]|uniref:HAD family hydrolase n=1 Tax=Demequina oxidasica TaxID=676199 RepID=UPI00078234CC|nr:HAD family phosphatase [Demequina oxidasica]